MAYCDPDGQGARECIETALKADDLRLVEIDEIREVSSIEDVKGVDEHLAQNVGALEPGKTVVWGTIHAYIADGEA
ncbi:MAG TPA: hypothetical protein VGM17_18570 [Rhizomicrobium sp.]